MSIQQVRHPSVNCKFVGSGDDKGKNSIPISQENIQKLTPVKKKRLVLDGKDNDLYPRTQRFQWFLYLKTFDRSSWCFSSSYIDFGSFPVFCSGVTVRSEKLVSIGVCAMRYVIFRSMVENEKGQNLLNRINILNLDSTFHFSNYLKPKLCVNSCLGYIIKSAVRYMSGVQPLYTRRMFVIWSTGKEVMTLSH